MIHLVNVVYFTNIPTSREWVDQIFPVSEAIVLQPLTLTEENLFFSRLCSDEGCIFCCLSFSVTKFRVYYLTCSNSVPSLTASVQRIPDFALSLIILLS